MPVVTLLCAPRDEAFGRIAAAALERAGHQAHWPANVADAGDLALDEDAALVIWSAASLPLLPFHQPALDAASRGVLVPIVIDGSPPPPGFEDLAPVNLAGWQGEEEDPRWRFVLEEIELAAMRRGRADPAPDPSHRDAEYADAAAIHEADISSVEEAAAHELLAQEEAPAFDDVAPARRQSRFGATAMALSGASLLVVLAAGAVLIAPSFDKVVEAPGEPTIAFVQPVGPVEEDTSSSAGADFEVTVTRTETLEASGLIAETVEEIAAAIPDTDLSTDAADISSLPLIETPGAPATDGAAPEAPITDETVAIEDRANAASEGSATEVTGAADPVGQGDSDPADDPAITVARETVATETLAAAAPDPDDMERLVAEVAGVEPSIGAASASTFRDCTTCPEMTAIPAGRFTMGAPVGEMARQAYEGPAREAAIERDFALGAREVTFAEWDACVADGGCRAYTPYDHGWGRAVRPVVGVSYEDAQSYVTWLSAETGETYRLPSEAEWEYAARAGGAAPFSFAGALTHDKANYDSAYPYDGPAAEARGKTTPAGSFAPNAFGLYDMHGNVWEWTGDCWRDGGAGADCGRRVLKGGAWNTGGWRLRAGHRIGKATGAREFNKGFRVARELN